MKFTLKEFNKMWEHFDEEDKNELLVKICGLGDRQQQAIIYINDKNAHETSSKKALDLLGFNDQRSFEKFRSRAIKRVLNILNSKKHNNRFEKFYKYHIK